ncbi:SRPBCC domain-containing protein [Rubellimicrobium rubrum]|nr:SRPBCC domain-containing protein [Rubellimicrobium rubrum]
MDTATLPDDRVLTITRWFRASPAQVYAAWTDPEALPRWFGPNGYSCEAHAKDLRVGGE